MSQENSAFSPKINKLSYDDYKQINYRYNHFS